MTADKDRMDRRATISGVSYMPTSASLTFMLGNHMSTITTNGQRTKMMARSQACLASRKEPHHGC